MIPFDFEYYRPQTIAEATELYDSLQKQGRQVIYYSGGTEIITLGRTKQTVADAVIDIKDIRECNVVSKENGEIVLGSATTLADTKKYDLFPMLSKTVGEVADHTARNKITIGGNICSQIIYREGVLPFLLVDSEVVIAGKNGQRKIPISEIFNKQLNVKAGEFLVQVITDQQWLVYPFRSVKRRKQGNVGYPLMTIVAIKANQQIRLAISGLCSYPFRDLQMEEALNNSSLTLEQRIATAITCVPGAIVSDVEGSAEYREFVLQKTLEDILMSLEGDGHV